MQREEKFLKAESLRLRYVAATRAGAALIITKRESGRGGSPWQPFHRHLSSVREIHDFSQTQNPPKELIEVTIDEVKQVTRGYRIQNDPGLETYLRRLSSQGIRS